MASEVRIKWTKANDKDTERKLWWPKVCNNIVCTQYTNKLHHRDRNHAISVPVTSPNKGVYGLFEFFLNSKSTSIFRAAGTRGTRELVELAELAELGELRGTKGTKRN